MSATLKRARELDPLTLSSVEVRLLSRSMRESPGGADVRVAFAGNVVFQPLPEFVEAHLVCHGMTAASYVAPFGQPTQELLDPHSALSEFDPNFLVLHFELDAFLPGLLGRATDEGTDARRAAVHDVLSAITPTVQAALSMTRATVLLTNFFGPDCYDLGIADSRAEFGEQELYAQLNLELAREFRTESRVQIVDLCRLTACYGRERARDRRLYYVAKIPWHESFVPVLADELVRHIGAAMGRIRKCLVVDLDDTLWGGVLGEDGPGGIRVGLGDPVAEAHLDLQRRILALKKRGILLAACSKNNPEEIDEVFRTRPDMPLQRDDFVCMQIGWDMKHQGLQRIAAQLNIGTDSLVFLDDNPAEIALVRQFLPEVECVLVPKDPAARPGCLDRVHGLDRTVITTDDLVKTRQYQDNAARDSARREFPNVQRYLQSLHTRVTVELVSPVTLPRAQQLFAKTNQFNLTTRRYSHGELETLVADDGNRVLIIRAEDRFGDLGWIGALVLREIHGPHAHIENFVLSCRAMGREIETALLNHVKHLCFARSACVSLTADCLPNARNVPVTELYERQGFTLFERGENGLKRYRLERSVGAPSECDCVALVEG
jgi:FkbH-like protein